MALSVRLLGLSSFAILLPQALMGVATVGVVYTTVKRQFGAAAGLIAGVVLALTPVAALMFTFNNPDALLTLLMALGAWATIKAIEQASPKWMMIVGVFIGLGFLTKTLQVLLVVPFFGLAYLIAAPRPCASASSTRSSPSAPWCCRPAGGSRSSSSSRPRPARTSVAARRTRSSS